MEKRVLSYREIAELAIYAEIALENYRLGTSEESERESILKLKEWLVNLPSTSTRVGTDPIMKLALDRMLARFFHQSGCRELHELAPRMAQALLLFDFSNHEEARKLFNLCKEIATEFLNLDAQQYRPRNYMEAQVGF